MNLCSFHNKTLQKGCCQLLTLNRYNIQQWLKTFDTIIYDADGVIWKHEDPIEGSPETFNALRAMGKNAFICTNHSATSTQELWKKATDMGLLLAQNEVLSSSQALARYLKERKFKRKVYIFGGKGIQDELNEVNIESLPLDMGGMLGANMLEHVQNMELDPLVGAVAVGMDQYMCVPKITTASCYLMDPKVMFVATNRDLSFPVGENRMTPGAGTMVAAIQAVVKRAPFTCGKPSPFICAHLMREGVIKAERTLMVGDTMYTDIQFGYNCGFQTLMVGTGVSSLEDVSKAQKSKEPLKYQEIPDLYVPKLSDLLPFLASRNR